MSVPKLRFPEFAGAWHQTRLGKRVTKVGSGITPKGGAGVYQSEGIPLIRSQNVRDSMLDLSNVAFISDEINATMRGSAVLPNDVLLNITGASIGRSCVTPENLGPANVNQHVCIIRLDADASPHFLQSFLASHKGQKLIAEAQSGSGREGLNFENIRTFKLIFPTLPEQQKIAAFLGAVDAKLAALAAKQAALGRFKAGLMQKLFSQQLRFTRDGGKAFPDWEEKRLGDVAEIIGGGTPDTDVADYWNGAVVWFTPSEIKKKYLTTSVRKISESGLSSSSAKMLPVGALVLSTRATVGDVGIATLPCATNQGFQSLVVKGKNYNEFWYYWLKHNKKALLRRSAGSTFLEIGKSEVQKIPVEKPHPDEQQKITAALSAMDAKIQAVADQVSKLAAFKKGLLQQMFV
jgi:type I restriction enzyme S subunit